MHVAVITGASMGLGEEFARQLAARRKNLVLIARSQDRLEELAQELEQRYRIRALPLVCDLSQPDAAKKIHHFLKDQGLYPTWLINNAGFGRVGDFDSMDHDHIHNMMIVNMVALTELTHLLLPMLRLSRDARVINVASTAAFQPVPYFSVYAATKAFVLQFSEGLSEELRHSDVHILALCPGPTPTSFALNNEIDPELLERGISAQQVVQMGLHASDRSRAVVITQRTLPILLIKLLPRFVVRYVAGFIAKRILKKMQMKQL